MTYGFVNGEWSMVNIDHSLLPIHT